jgi:acyl-CoA thioesterase FadM
MTRIDIKVPEKVLYETHFTIQPEDINSANHMGNERILFFSNTVRTDFYNHLGLEEGVLAEGHGTIIANHAIKYVSEGFLGDEITCQVGIAEFTSCSFDLIFHFFKKDKKTLALVRSGVVYFNYNERRISELPKEFSMINLE